MHETRTDGVLICKQCRDPLMKKPLINSRRYLGLIAASAFIAPLLIMIVFVIKDITTDKFPNNSKNLVHLSFD